MCSVNAGSRAPGRSLGWGESHCGAGGSRRGQAGQDSVCLRVSGWRQEEAAQGLGEEVGSGGQESGQCLGRQCMDCLLGIMCVL